MIVAIGKPRKAMELTKPSWVSVSPKSAPSWPKIPALMANVIEVTTKEIQLAWNSLRLLIELFRLIVNRFSIS